MAPRFKTEKGSRGAKIGALTKADLIVLSLLSERSMNGYELVREYERQEVADWASVSKAQVYYAMQKLTSLKMLSSIQQVAEGGSRNRTIYSPTKLGHMELVKSLNGAEWVRARVAQPFSTWLGLSIHLPADAIAKILISRQAFLLEELEREKSSLSFIRTLTSTRARVGCAIVELVIRQFQVELEWIDDLLK